jgi:hypothetical protein
LDCCSSAGITRGEDFEESENYAIRRISNPPQFKDSTDKEIWSRGTRGGDIAYGFSGKCHASHVLLAACGSEQDAREHPVTKKGIFTNVLMNILRKSDINSLTYTSLIHKMDMPWWCVFTKTTIG